MSAKLDCDFLTLDQVSAGELPIWCSRSNAHHKVGQGIVRANTKVFARGEGCTSCIRKDRQCFIKDEYEKCAACSSLGGSTDKCIFKNVEDEPKGKSAHAVDHPDLLKRQNYGEKSRALKRQREVGSNAESGREEPVADGEEMLDDDLYEPDEAADKQLKPVKADNKLVTIPAPSKRSLRSTTAAHSKCNLIVTDGPNMPLPHPPTKKIRCTEALILANDASSFDKTENTKECRTSARTTRQSMRSKSPKSVLPKKPKGKAVSTTSENTLDITAEMRLVKAGDKDSEALLQHLVKQNEKQAKQIEAQATQIKFLMDRDLHWSLRIRQLEQEVRGEGQVSSVRSVVSDLRKGGSMGPDLE